MKRLCKAECSAVFCFVTNADDKKLTEEAYAHSAEFRDLDIDVDFVNVIEDSSEIPSEWLYKTPLGSTDKKDCMDFFENLDEATRIANRLEKLDYDLEETFVEDLQHILNTPLEEEEDNAKSE